MSATLYEKRFGPYFCQPVIAGLEPDGTPYLCGMDSIGAWGDMRQGRNLLRASTVQLCEPMTPFLLPIRCPLTPSPPRRN